MLYRGLTNPQCDTERVAVRYTVTVSGILSKFHKFNGIYFGDDVSYITQMIPSLMIDIRSPALGGMTLCVPSSVWGGTSAALVSECSCVL